MFLEMIDGSTDLGERRGIYYHLPLPILDVSKLFHFVALIESDERGSRVSRTRFEMEGFFGEVAAWSRVLKLVLKGNY